MQNTSVT